MIELTMDMSMDHLDYFTAVMLVPSRISTRTDLLAMRLPA
jgi:hypothetical protein